jgi:hypothetical protein
MNPVIKPNQTSSIVTHKGDNILYIRVRSYCGPVDTHLADECVLTKQELPHVFLPRHMLACPLHGPWATCIRLSHVKAEREFPTLQNGDLSAKGENPDRETSILQDCRGLA